MFFYHQRQEAFWSFGKINIPCPTHWEPLQKPCRLPVLWVCCSESNSLGGIEVSQKATKVSIFPEMPTMHLLLASQMANATHSWKWSLMRKSLFWHFCFSFHLSLALLSSFECRLNPTFHCVTFLPFAQCLALPVVSVPLSSKAN